MSDPILLHPFPVLVAPQRSIPIPAGFDKFEKLRIRHIVNIDLECPHVDAVLVELVVPTEGNAIAIGAERCDTGRNAHSFV